MVSTNLILDLLKLLKKHGPDSFDELATYLKTPSNFNNLTLILENISKQSKASTAAYKDKELGEFHNNSKKSSSATRSPKNLDSLKNSDPDKYEFLNGFYQELLSKQMLDSLRKINFFREDNSLNQSKAKSHREGIVALINDLANFPLEKLRKLEIPTVSEKKGLQGWSDIIMKKS